ncbi:MAG: hypothetical protein HRU27_10280 [Rhizobiaceae bacterium]|nr:hypothetical protein [Rhizobiaceae bacterium]
MAASTTYLAKAAGMHAPASIGRVNVGFALRGRLKGAGGARPVVEMLSFIGCLRKEKGWFFRTSL